MSTITVHIDDKLKKSVVNHSKKQGITLTFLVTKLFEAYNKGKINLEMVTEEEKYELLSKRFEDVAKRKTKKGKEPSLSEQLADL